ncbi:MAG: DEAD/DEAH box helicase [bacterium]|nr:DEAD/DEAH box helicase [bacterium]
MPSTPKTESAQTLLVLHANASKGRLHLWAERSSLHGCSDDRPEIQGENRPHPATVASAELLELLRPLLGEHADAKPASLTLRLPEHDGRPFQSPQLAHWTGHATRQSELVEAASFGDWEIQTVAIDADRAPRLLERLSELSVRDHDRAFDEEAHPSMSAGSAHIVHIGDSARWFLSAARLGVALLVEQRFVPMLLQDDSGQLQAAWRPWFSDEATAERVTRLLRSMPAVARAQIDDLEHGAWAITTSFIGSIVDHASRRVLRGEAMSTSLAGKRAQPGDPHVEWLRGLLDQSGDVNAAPSDPARMFRSVRHWVGGLEDRGISGEWRLRLSLHEPLLFDDADDQVFGTPGDEVLWSITFSLQSVENPNAILEAEDLWVLRGDSCTIEGLRLDNPKELILAELARAARLYKPLEAALSESEPTIVDLPTTKAYEFLREVAPLLEEQGFGVERPLWWDTPAARIGGRLSIQSPELDPDGNAGGTPGAVGAARLGLNALVSYEWNLAIGDNPLTLKEFENLANQKSPLVRINGQWVEVRPEDVKAAVEFIHANPGGQMKIGDALRMAFGGGMSQAGLPILGIDATGWAATLLSDMENRSMTLLDVPEGFKGELRPYQQKGLSWLAFLDQMGLGPCLADDMGLGKTIQLIALLVLERNQHKAAIEAGLKEDPVGPTLLVVPMSIVGNWMREARKFAPSLRLMIHHGADRETGEEFVKAAGEHDVTITTYALAHRDREMLGQVHWHRVVLDEAQNIKNPSAKQSQAVRQLDAPRRIALTGTPLENRLSELWSIIDFCNPGFLGTPGEFRRTFSIPVERYRDKQRAQQLRQLVQPFILRRLKTDPTVISDLPEKLESKEFCRLTTEQAQMYEATVKEMLGEVERAEGIRRRGIVLTTLIRLKQICNHPTLLLKETDDDEITLAEGVPQASRSGKCIRLLEMVDEVISGGDQALVFTQFRQMGHLLSAMIRHTFDRDVLFLHGGVPQKQREKMVERFQKADGSAPIFLLSLKAGGVGLNLTAASHVFHFDRWWNPAVENQATDRAFRIGQKKTVNVHKFMVGGTLEERIDQMIESKVALAQDIIGAGEDWLTELSTAQLRDVLQLRPDAYDEPLSEFVPSAADFEDAAN